MRVKLSDAFDLQMGKTPSRGEPDYWNGENAWVSIADLSNAGKYISETKECITDIGVARSGIRVVPRNTVIMSFKLSIGKTAITAEDMYTNEAIMAFIDKGVYPINVHYLYHLFSNMDWSEGSNKAVMGITLNKTTLSEKVIELPDMAEQQEVAAMLDHMDTLISLRKQQIAKLDELVKARFVEMFIGKGYPTKTIDEVSRAKGEYGAQSASAEYDPARPRYVRITDINDDGTLNDDVVASSNITDDEQYRLEYGDFMFARMGATVGKTYAFIKGNQIFAGYLIRYKLKCELVNPHYLFWYTRLDEYWNWVKLNQSGAAQPGINAKKFGSLQIPLPPIEEQNAFATFVAQTDQQKLTMQHSLAQLELLKKALMQKYFG